MPTPLELVDGFSEFHARLLDEQNGRIACKLGGELFPFEHNPVDPMQLLSEALNHPKVRILRQQPGKTVDVRADYSAQMRSIPVEAAAEDPYLHISLFEVADLCQPGRSLHFLCNRTFTALEKLWRSNGLSWNGDLWPILFIAGSKSATNYHIDPTPNMTYHLFGKKRFHGLKQPDRWCPDEVKERYLGKHVEVQAPDGISDADCVCHDNQPGDLVWIPLLTPHWVNAGSFSATITFAFKHFRMDIDGNAQLAPAAGYESRQMA